MFFLDLLNSALLPGKPLKPVHLAQSSSIQCQSRLVYIHDQFWAVYYSLLDAFKMLHGELRNSGGDRFVSSFQNAGLKKPHLGN